MKFDVRWIDVNQALQTQEQPVYFYERPKANQNPGSSAMSAHQQARVGEFYVPTGPLNQSGAVPFGLTKAGDHVRIPVFAYRTKDRALSAIWGTGIQIGMDSIHQLAKHCQAAVSEVILVLGHECHDLGNDGFRCYAGLALRTK